MTAPLRPLWKQILDEVVLGNRGLIKLNGLWFPLALCLTVSPPGPAKTATAAFFLIAGAVAGWLLSAIIVNDIADRLPDGAESGKWISRLSPAARIIVALLLTLWAWAVPVLSKAGSVAAWSLPAASAAGFLYSVQPFRLKEKGLAGIAAYSISCVLGYVVFPWAWLGVRVLTLLVLAPAVFLDKWTNLHFHQLADLDKDRRAAVRTYAVRAGLERTRRTLRRAAGLACLALAAAPLASWISLDPAWRLVGLSAVGAAALAARFYTLNSRRSPTPSPLVRELPWPYLALTHGVLRVYPLVLLARLAAGGSIAWTAGAAAAAAVGVEAISLARSAGHLGKPPGRPPRASGRP